MMLLRLILAAALLALGPAARTQRATGFVVAQGDARAEAADFEGALVQARAMRSHGRAGPIVITFPAGTLRIAAPLALAVNDGGTATAPLVLRAAPGGSTVSGARVIAGAEDGAFRLRLDRPFDFGTWHFGDQALPARPQLFAGDRRLTLTRWPATGFARGWSSEATPAGLMLRPTGAQVPRFAGTALVEGYLGADYAFEATPAVWREGGLLLPGFTPKLPAVATARVRVRGIGVPGANDIAIEESALVIGPTEDAPIEQAEAAGLLSIADARHIRIEGLAFEKSAGTAVSVRNGEDIAFVGCRIAYAAASALDVRGGTRVSVDRCRIDDTGGTAVRIEGGDRYSLAASGHAITRSTIARFGRTVPEPGVVLWGQAIALRDSRIAGGPQSGVALYGNDHRIEGNAIGWVVCEANDAGALYMGRDWSQRGIVVRDNLIHDVGGARRDALAVGVYLDDQFSGATIVGNAFLRVPHGVFIGGGRDNAVTGNLFARIDLSALIVDQRGLEWQAALAGPGGQLRTTLERLPFRSGRWAQRYPTLATMLEDRPGAAVNNRFTGNSLVASQSIWARPTTLAIAHDEDRKPDPGAAGWRALEGDAAAAWPVLARLGGLVPDPGWRAAAPTGVAGCE